jgi:hypothetical protein
MRALQELTLIVAILAGTIGGSQVPRFVQEYEQRLGGASQEADRQLAEYRRIAEATGQPFADYLRQLSGNEDPSVAATGRTITASEARHRPEGSSRGPGASVPAPEAARPDAAARPRAPACDVVPVRADAHPGPELRRARRPVRLAAQRAPLGLGAATETGPAHRCTGPDLIAAGPCDLDHCLSLSEALREQETTEASAERNDLASSIIYDAAAQPSHGGRPCTRRKPARRPRPPR